jgi:hypothetical protein
MLYYAQLLPSNGRVGIFYAISDTLCYTKNTYFGIKIEYGVALIIHVKTHVKTHFRAYYRYVRIRYNDM